MPGEPEGENGKAAVPQVAGAMEYDEKRESESKRELKYLVLAERANKRQFDDLDEYCQEVINYTSKQGVSAKIRKIHFQDFQFGDSKLVEIYEKERMLKAKEEEMDRKLLYLQQLGKEEAYEELKKQISTDEYSLSDDLRQEKIELESLSFMNWTRSDFKAFLDALHRNGRNDSASTVNEVSAQLDKDPSNVKRYFDTFWSRYGEMEDGVKIVEGVDKAEELIVKKKELTKSIVEKVDLSAGNLHNLSLRYGSSKGKVYSDEEDAFLILMLQKYGYGEWKKVVFEIKNSWLFRFDSFFKSRTPSDIKNRCNTLIKLLEMEHTDSHSY